MEIFNYKEVEAKHAEKGTSGLRVRWLITKELGAENFAMRLFEMEPGGYSPFHGHPWEHEVFVLEGKGLVVDDKEERKFGAGDVIFISADEKHQFRNNGDKTVKFLCLIPYTQEYVRAH